MTRIREEEEWMEDDISKFARWLRHAVNRQAVNSPGSSTMQ